MNRVVIYTPQEDFWYNSDIGPAFILWFFSFAVAALIVAGAFGNRIGKPELKPWQFAALTACVTYTIHCGAVWLLAHL